MSAVTSMDRLMSFCEAVGPYRKAVTELSQATGKDKRVCALALAIVNAQFFKAISNFLTFSILSLSAASTVRVGLRVRENSIELRLYM